MRRLVGLFAFFISFVAASSYAAETTTYYHHDALGSAVAATDESGNLLWREDYRPYGERIRNPANTDNSLWYTGKPEEAQLGLQYFGARWYDPSMGRFTGIDPVGFSEGNIHSFNAYAYAANNPYRYIDPDGRDLAEVFADLNINTGTPGPQWKVNMVKGIWAAYAITPLLVVPGVSEIVAEEVFSEVSGLPVSPRSLGKNLIRNVTKSGQKLLETPRDVLLRNANDPRLKDAINNLYRPGAKVGSGSTADAVRFERATGELLSPKGHTQKLIDRRTQLMKLRKDPDLSAGDRRIIHDILKDTQNALSN